MNAVRKAASWSALITWVYSWIYFRGIRADMEGPLPGALVATMGAVTTLLIGTAVSGWMKLRWWPLIALASGLLFVGVSIWAQHAVMTSALNAIGSDAKVGFSDAVMAMLRQRSLVGLLVFAGGPTIMALSGVTGIWKMRGDR